MSKRLLAVFGATGQQGKSIIEHVLQDPELSSKYALRGLSRDPSNPASQALSKQGIEMVKCDTDSDTDLKAALKDVHTAFVMTHSVATPTGGEEEIKLGKHIADLVVESGAQYLIWSSMISPKRLSGGKYQRVDIFDSKYEVEQYIRKLPIKSSFFIPGTFMQNFQSQQKPRPLGDGTFGLFNVYRPDSTLPLIDIAGDTGKWISAILAEPDKYAGKGISCATRLYTLTEIAETMSRVSGKTVKQVQIPDEKFASFVPEGARPIYSDMTQYIREVGYFGANQDAELKWGAEQARGRLTSLEEYLKRDPIKYDD